MALKFLEGLKHIASVNEARETLDRLVDYIKFRPLETENPKKVTYDSMAVRDIGINAAAVKLIKFFQQVEKNDPSVRMYLELIKKYFLDAYDWSDLEQEGYDDFESDALWFCEEIGKYLKEMPIFFDGKKKKTEPLGDVVLRHRTHAE